MKPHLLHRIARIVLTATAALAFAACTPGGGGATPAGSAAPGASQAPAASGAPSTAPSTGGINY